MIDRVGKNKVRTKQKLLDAYLKKTIVWRFAKLFSLLIFSVIMYVIFLPYVSAELQIHQVLYDPAGTDTGYEWVELYNNGNDVVSLDNYSVYFSRASNGSSWDLIFDGSVKGGSILAEDYYVIGDEKTLADVIVPLSLQNTKGAIKLIKKGDDLSGEIIDLIGYGDVPIDYYLGSPAKLVGSGQSLKRISDTENNGIDFVFESNPSFSSSSRQEVAVINILNSPPEIAILNYTSLGNLSVNFNLTDNNGYTDILGLEYNSLDYSGLFNVTCNGVCQLNKNFLVPTGVQSYTYEFRVFDRSNTFSDWISLDFLRSKTVSFDIERVSSVDAYPGQNVQIEVQIVNTGNSVFDIDIAGSFSKGTSSIPISSTKAIEIQAGEHRTISIPVRIPSMIPSGQYSGKLVLAAK